MTEELTKDERRRLRELAAVAHERELAAELAKVEAEFTRWRGGQITAFDLTEAIHRFHQGAGRELFKKYNGDLLDLVVAQALHWGLLARDEVGAELGVYLARFDAVLGGRA